MLLGGLPPARAAEPQVVFSLLLLPPLLLLLLPTRGYCVLPARCLQGTVYWAAQGQGAFVQRPGAEAPQRLQAAEVDLAAPGLVVVGSGSHLTAETKEFVAALQEPSFKQLGSSLKLLMVGGCWVWVDGWVLDSWAVFPGGE
jgi:3'-phosphoadenosine 5'-phosphosulfate (PAPS) 3'-phosphatase